MRVPTPRKMLFALRKYQVRDTWDNLDKYAAIGYLTMAQAQD